MGVGDVVVGDFAMVGGLVVVDGLLVVALVVVVVVLVRDRVRTKLYPLDVVAAGNLRLWLRR